MASDSKTEILSLRDHLIYICSRLLAYGVPMVIFLVTTSFYLKTYDSAQIKITFTQIGTTILLFIWLTKILLEGRLPFGKKDFLYVAPFLAFLASGLISYIHTPFKVWSLEETLRRIFYMVLALITIAEFRSEERMTRLWRWLLAAAWVAIGYGVVQYIDTRFFLKVDGVDPFIWRQAFGARVFSTFGNPNFYGNFLVIVTPLILASVLREKGSLLRPFAMVGIVLCLVLLVDMTTLKNFGAIPSSFRVIASAAILLLFFSFFLCAWWGVGSSISLPMSLILFALLFLNLYGTETKGAWLGFTAAVAATLGLILEYFFHLEEKVVERKKYLIFSGTLLVFFVGLIILMVMGFVLPFLRKEVQQIGFSILWIPTVAAALISVWTMFWVMRQPWTLKKIVYSLLIFFVLSMGAGVLQFAKTRLTSVSFRLFTWIGTWEMIRTEPIFGNGVGTFKVIYPAYRRPQIIVLEAKSNTETDHSEDEYLEVWQDEGIIGFGIFLWMIVTALGCGLKQLRWYSTLRVPDRKHKFFELDSDPRSYEVLGILGAYIGALFHWTVDVSIRFVSSGIFSGLLPGILVAYARNHDNPIRNEVRLPYERWVRVGFAALVTSVFLYLGLELVPQNFIKGGETTDFQIAVWIIFAGIALFVLMELLEIGNKPQKNVPFHEQYSTPSSKLFFIRVGAVLLIGVVTLKSISLYGGFFQADVHHNLAIFFSKQAIWTKSPKYDANINAFPPDIRKKYRRWGGALEHYEEVNKNNHAFPMARYFTGNVYNDWGSQKFGEAMQARNKGDAAEAARQHADALAKWDKAEEAYSKTKEIAPNYVQTHHQVGLLFVKRADAARQWGDDRQAQELYAKALENFSKYKIIDPVFPPNYDRIAQIHLMYQRFKETEELYKEAIYYNDVVAKSIHKGGFPERAAEICVSLAKVFYTHASHLAPDPFHPRLPEVDEAIKYFELAVEKDPKNLEAWKGLGFILDKAGEKAKAQEAFRKALQIAPQDPDLKLQAGSG